MNADKNDSNVWQNLKNRIKDFRGDLKIEYEIGSLFGYLKTTPYPKDEIKRERLKERLQELKAENKLIDAIKDAVDQQNKQEELLIKLTLLKADLEEAMESEV
jgi:hypothetical protein